MAASSCRRLAGDRRFELCRSAAAGTGWRWQIRGGRAMPSIHRYDAAGGRRGGKRHAGRHGRRIGRRHALQRGVPLHGIENRGQGDRLQRVRAGSAQWQDLGLI